MKTNGKLQQIQPQEYTNAAYRVINNNAVRIIATPSTLIIIIKRSAKICHIVDGTVGVLTPHSP